MHLRSIDDHLANPHVAPPLSGADVVEGTAGGSCGVVARFWLQVDDHGVIVDCGYRMRGRAVAFAVASALTEVAPGLDIVAASRLGLITLHESFSGLSDEDLERARVTEDAWHHAINAWLIRQMADPDGVRLPVARQLTRLVAMSGGVDSAVALYRTISDVAPEHSGQPAASSVAGVTLRLWIDPKAPDPEAACCSPDSVRRARWTCHRAGVGHITLDLRNQFARTVVAPFLERYAAGETPNPCVGCNGEFRLDELVSLADVVGADHVATGHYVRTVERAGRTMIQRGVDHTKDQSYMLSTLHPTTVARFVFPLGSSVKTDVRVEAAQLGLAQAKVPDSQDVCFLGGGDYREFLDRTNSLGRSGEIRDLDGNVLGTHDGIARFTPGQRKGLGVERPRPTNGETDHEPIYVIDVDPASGIVLVGSRSQLPQRRIRLRGVRLWDASVERVDVRVRYRVRDGACWGQLMTHAETDETWLELEDPVSAPAPGQIACMYDNDGVVVGAATIVRTALASPAPIV